MATLGLALLLGLAIAAASLTAQWWRRARRDTRFNGLDLRPNCLLTRHPIAFLAPPPSLFRFFDPWSDVPLYLREHGYEVLEIHSPDELTEKCHLVTEASRESALHRIADANHPMVASLTVVRTRSSASKLKSSTVSVADLKPRAIAIDAFQVPRLDLERLLDLAISLAERDAMLSD